MFAPLSRYIPFATLKINVSDELPWMVIVPPYWRLIPPGTLITFWLPFPLTVTDD